MDARPLLLSGHLPHPHQLQNPNQIFLVHQLLQKDSALPHDHSPLRPAPQRYYRNMLRAQCLSLREYLLLAPVAPLPPCAFLPHLKHETFHVRAVDKLHYQVHIDNPAHSSHPAPLRCSGLYLRYAFVVSDNIVGAGVACLQTLHQEEVLRGGTSGSETAEGRVQVGVQSVHLSPLVIV